MAFCFPPIPGTYFLILETEMGNFRQDEQDEQNT
jgi:hypothetical protein